MNGLVKVLAVTLFACGLAMAAEKPVVEAIHVKNDTALTTDPSTKFWHQARPTFLEKDIHGNTISGRHGEVRVRWTEKNLYFLFTCPYDQLYLKPEPNSKAETNELWKWDVAEVFVGSDFNDIKRYKEFEVSPQGEWVDLDINLHIPHHEDGWKWNSGFEAKARIDSASHLWYAAMRIPISAVDTRPAAAGNTLRINFFLSEGPESDHHEWTWQAPMGNTFHAPEKFGLLKLSAR